MKVLVLTIILVICSGCASKDAYEMYNNSFENSASGYYKALDKPLVDITLPAPDGKEYHVVVNREVKQMLPQQIKDSEWVAPVSSFVSGAASVGGIYALSALQQKPTVVTQPTPLVVRPEVVK